MAYNPIKLTEFCILAINKTLYENNEDIPLNEKHNRVYDLEKKALDYAENELIQNIEKYESFWLGTENIFDNFKNKQNFKKMKEKRDRLKNRIAIEWVRQEYNI